MYKNGALQATTLYVYTRIHSYLMNNHASRSSADFLVDVGTPATTSTDGTWNIAPYNNATSFTGSDFDFYYTFKSADKGKTIKLLIELPTISGYYNAFLVYFEDRDSCHPGNGNVALNSGSVSYSSSVSPIFHKINITTTDNPTDPNYEIISSGIGMIFYIDGTENSPWQKINDSIYSCGIAHIDLEEHFF